MLDFKPSLSSIPISFIFVSFFAYRFCFSVDEFDTESFDFFDPEIFEDFKLELSDLIILKSRVTVFLIFG